MKYTILLRKEFHNNWNGQALPGQNCELALSQPHSPEYTFLKVSASTGLEEYVLTKDLHLYPKEIDYAAMD